MCADNNSETNKNHKSHNMQKYLIEEEDVREEEKDHHQHQARIHQGVQALAQTE